MEIITRKEAIEIGQSWFFTGIPCKNGHIDKIGVSRWHCYECRRQYKKEKRNENIEKAREKARESYKRNVDKILERAKKNYPNIKEERQAYLKDYYQKNKDDLKQKASEYFKANKEKVYKYKKLWNKTETGRNTARAIGISKRKAGYITAKQVKELKLKFKNKCYWCNCDVSKGYHIDHYVSIAKGGTSDFNNLVMSCSSCNISKSAKDPFVFAITKGKLL